MNPPVHPTGLDSCGLSPWLGSWPAGLSGRTPVDIPARAPRPLSRSPTITRSRAPLPVEALPDFRRSPLQHTRILVPPRLWPHHVLLFAGKSIASKFSASFLPPLKCRHAEHASHPHPPKTSSSSLLSSLSDSLRESCVSVTKLALSLSLSLLSSSLVSSLFLARLYHLTRSQLLTRSPQLLIFPYL
jgi:hypothetical protein